MLLSKSILVCDTMASCLNLSLVLCVLVFSGYALARPNVLDRPTTRKKLSDYDLSNGEKIEGLQGALDFVENESKTSSYDYETFEIKWPDIFQFFRNDRKIAYPTRTGRSIFHGPKFPHMP
ncbi:uncharacterized protein LOC103519077 [Diaphorina citri]|uniref:Uncharacterized protein LOC103519077 n=1 Tax=Diaphorina citri TaxID=121845 RepID=A0A1S3DIJ2_DIACI|nr:uncharacterized protein LOC103519077 [Diaphorina citri]XP_008482381.1 uncharacterized protein LOC103519077 [Diaphorina citri]XP_017303539.1 uncharacterized protein LOC103519077 [Diaphorina citri]